MASAYWLPERVAGPAGTVLAAGGPGLLATLPQGFAANHGERGGGFSRSAAGLLHPVMVTGLVRIITRRPPTSRLAEAGVGAAHRHRFGQLVRAHMNGAVE